MRISSELPLSLAMRFSQRMGKRPIKTILQIDSIDDPLMNRLWNSILEDFFYKISDVSYDSDSNRSIIGKVIWKEFYGLRIDLMPAFNSGRIYFNGILEYIEDWFFNKAEWDEIYDFIEFLSKIDKKSLHIGFVEECNRELKKEVSGYRIVDETVVQITSEEEIQSIEEALYNTDIFKSVNEHLNTALSLLADRQSPDYRNSIKESISAVEALCKIITKDEKSTLGKALAIIEKQHKLHGSLKEAYSKIYGYASDADGIRHSMLEDGIPIDFEDAKFMLVSCSAFINYLKSKLKL